MNVQCASDVPAPVDLTAVDNCDGDITVSPSAVITPGDCDNNFTMVRTWTFTDGCGNTSSVSQTINVNDNTAPEITCPSGVTLEAGPNLDTSPTATGSAIATDNCDSAPVITFSDIVTPGNCVGQTTITRTWTATDSCGNSSSCDQIINVGDDSPPVITCPSNVELECIDGLDTSPSTQGFATAIDSNDPNPVITFSDVISGNQPEPKLWINEFHYDNDGADFGEFIEVAGTAGLDLSGYSIVLYNGSNGTVYNTINLSGSIDDEGLGFGAVDFQLPSNGLQNGSPDGFALVNGTTLIEFLSYEGSLTGVGGIADGLLSTDIGVSEIGSTPIGHSLQLNGTGNMSGDFSWSEPTLESPGILNSNQTLIPENNGSCSNYTITRTWTATDDCGNSSSCDQIIEILDTTAPVTPEAPADVNVQCASEVPLPMDLKAIDDCEGEINTTPIDEITLGDCVNSFTEVRTWTFTDGCGNTSSVSQTITVSDDTAPDAPDAPMDVSICEDETIPLAVDLTATDNCDGNITVSPSEQIIPFENGYTLTRTWIFADICGNTSSVSQNIIVNSLPEITLIGEPECTNYAQTYSVQVLVTFGQIACNEGSIIDDGNGYYTINDIPKNTDISILVSSDAGCTTTLTVEAPDCTCIELDYDYTNVTCNGQDDGTIMVNFVTEGASITINGEPYVEGQLYTPGIYTIMAFFEGVDIDECIISEVIEITEPEHVSMDVSFTNITCFGADDATITVSNLSEGAVYTIKRNGYGPDLSGQELFGPGTYFVVATLENNSASRVSNYDKEVSRYDDPCQEIRIIVIDEPEPFVCNIIPNENLANGIICEDKGKYLDLIVNVSGNNGDVNYSWSIDDTGIENGWSINSESTNEQITFNPGYGPAMFYVEVNDENGCSSQCSIKLSAKCKPPRQEQNNFIGFMMYPNPVSSRLNVEFNEVVKSENVKVEVYNLVGTIMYTKLYKDFDADKLNIDFSSFPSAVYYLKITTEQGTQIKKVILDK